jgi:hypothetical protein
LLLEEDHTLKTKYLCKENFLGVIKVCQRKKTNIVNHLS